MSTTQATTLQQLAATFKQQASDPKNPGVITIDSTLLTDAITQVLGTDSITVAGVNPNSIPDDPGENLTISGSTSSDDASSILHIAGQPLCVNFFYTGTGADQTIVFQMQVNTGNDWTLGTSFPDVKGQAADFLVSTAAYIYISTTPAAQALASGTCAPGSAPASLSIVPGVSLWGDYSLAGPFAPVTALLSLSVPSFALYGPITEFTTDPKGPDINLLLQDSLSFEIPGGILSIENATLGMEILPVASPQAPDVVSLATVPYFQSGITVGSLPELILRANLYQNGTTVNLMIVPANPQQTTFESLIALVGGDGVTQLLSLVQSQPAVSSLLEAIAFKQFWATVNVSPPSLSMVSVLVGTIGYDLTNGPPPAPPTNAWKPFSDVALAFNFMGAVFNPTSASALPMGELDATCWVTKSSGDYFIFSTTVDVPAFNISGSVATPIELNLASLVSDLFGDALTLPNNLADFTLTDLGFTANVPNSYYTFGVTINGELFGADVLQFVNTAVSLTVDASGDKTNVTGTIDGIISLADIQFQVDAVISNDPKVDTVFTLHMVDETLGSLLNTLVHIVDSSLDISLPSPWDKILDISLDKLVLSVNVTKGSVGFSYDVGLDLGFIKIDTIGLTYQKDPVQSGVMVNITGSFLGKSYGNDSPLAWDAVNDQPPTVPQGTLLDMQYLGIGQHVTVQGLENQTTMAQIIKTMETAMKTDQPDFTNGLVFSDSSGWLMGTDFTVMGAVRLAVIFNDPKVYGLMLALSGDKVGSFAGLQFEILYRKVTDSIGLYHIDFTLPAAFRHLEFGEVSVTLPSVVVDVYTNGNFMIDLGFPHNMDFSRSFGLQIFPFVGYGGIYFGVLSGATSSRVPQISNGTFDPVIVFGFGLSLGVGKSIDEGVFSAGLSVTVQGALEGVFAWFNPNSSAVSSDTYYWLQGTIRIVGQLYGSVDFKIIKASVNVTAYAGVTLTIESYQPIYISLTAGVSVSVKVKVIFFTIHFSFSMTISASWTIGHASTTPWVLASGGGQQSTKVAALAAPGAFALGPVALFPKTLHPHRRYLGARATVDRTANLRAAANESSELQWTPVPTINTTPVGLNIVVGPVFTIAGNTPQVVPALFIENAIDADATKPDEVQKVADANDAGNKPFNQLATAMLQWTITAWERTQENPDGTINMGNLEYLQQQLADPDIEEVAFPYANLTAFLNNNFILQMSPRPESAQDDSSAAVFPMVPELSVTVNGTTTYFGDKSPVQVDTAYAEKLAAYFDAIMAEFMQGVADDGSGSGSSNQMQAMDDGGTESLATSIFRNYFYMIARSTVSTALDLLTSYPYAPGAQSLQEICAAFPTDGDEEATAESIVHANQSATDILTVQNVTLSGVTYQARSGDTVTSWLKPFGLTGLQLFTEATNAATPGLLQTGATVAINSAKQPPAQPLVFTTAAGDTFSLIASLMLVRSNGTSIYAQFSSLADQAQSIALLNNLQSLDPAAPIPSSVTTLTVPSGDPNAPYTYTVRPGDTLYAVAAYYLNTQQKVVPIDTFVAALTAAYPSVDPNNIPVGTKLTLPEIDHLVQPGESVATITAALLTDVTTLYGGSNLADVALQPLAAVALPPFQYAVQSSDTLASIAGQFNLTMADLAQALLTQESLFSAQITVPNVPRIAVTDLLNTLVAQGNLNTVSGMVSRFMLHGLQVPIPSDPITAEQLEQDPTLAAKVQVAPLYALMGQQMETPPSSAPTITVNNDGGVSWISFGTGNQDLTLTLSADELTLSNGLKGLVLDGNVALFRLPLFNNTPYRYTISQHSAWQAAQVPACLGAGAASGGPSLWMFPDTLIQELESAQDPNQRYGLYVGVQEEGNRPMEINPVKSYAWATMINVDVQKIPDSDQSPGAANAYMVAGADEVGQDLLHTLLPIVDDNTVLYLLYQPGPSGGDTGYASDVLDADSTFILQTNLSQLSNSPSANAMAFVSLTGFRAASTTPYAAPVSDPADFLNLLWECGVTRSGGYYLNYSAGGAGLPDTVFSSGTTATLGLLVVLNGNAVATPTEGLPPSFINCAVVGDNIDASNANVFVQPIVETVESPDSLQNIVTEYNKAFNATVDLTGVVTANQGVRGLLRPGAGVLYASGQPAYTVQEGDTFGAIAAAKNVSLSTLASLNATADILQAGALAQFAAGQLDQVAAVQQGNSGFQMVRPAPAQDDADSDDGTVDPATYLAQLFQMVEFQVNGNSFFNASGQGLPAGPTDPNPQGGDTLLAPETSPEGEWNYSQAFAIYPFAAGAQDVAPATDGLAFVLPTKVASPYAGIAPGAQVGLNLSFRDIFGNTGTASPPLSLPPIPVGYIDEIIGPGQWPGVSAWYIFGQDSGDAPQLTITMAFQSSRYTPGTSSDPTATIQAAASAAAKFVQAYNQMQQGDLIIRYRTSMDQTSMTDTGRDAGNPYLIDKATFVPFVAHALLFTGAMGALTPFQHTAASTDTVQSLVTAYDTSASDLFEANKDVAQDLLFEGSLTVPIQVSVRPQESLNDIINDAAQAGYSVTVDDLAQLNAAVPLATGVALTAPTARSYSTTGKEKLQDVTASLSCSIAGIVSANDKPGVLATGFVFTVQGGSGPVSYTVQSNDTFTTVAAAFDSQYHVTVTTTALATLNQDQPGIFAASIALTVPDVVVQAGQSLTSLQSQYGFTVADMATDNAAVAGIFAEATLLLVTTRSYSGDMTLAEVASQYQLSVDALGEANLTATFKDGALVTVPGRVLCNQTLPWPYRAAGTETIARLAAGLSLQSLDLLALSQDLPGIFPSGLSISVGKGTVTTTADSTFAGMLASLQAQDSTVTAAALAAAVETKTVTAGALIIFPPMAAGTAQSLQALSQRLNLGVADLAAANQNLQGFLQDGATLQYPATAGPDQWTYQTKSTDTLAAILDACNAFLSAKSQPLATLSDLANANATVAMVAQSSAVLPAAPDPVTINQAVKANLPDTLFALVVNLELDRLESLVDPDFDGVTPVSQSVTTLSPQGAADGSDSASLQPFAQSFEAAFPGLKVATGQGISETDSSGDRPLWVVDFADAGSGGPTPINYQLKTDGVAYYAVPPISNTLWGDTVQVPGYVSGQGLTADQSATFQSVDLDVWGRTFLEAVDLFLSPTYAVPAYQMDATNTATVISAKETLGDAIAAHLTDLFNTSSNADRLQAAQEILKQNLLVQLSQAYSVNTVVQYPVSVTSSPYTDPVTAARLSGKVTTSSYTTGTKDTLTTLADWVTAKANIDAGQVSVGYIAEMIAGLPGILAVGQVVLYSGAPYTITSSDTLSSVAGAFQVPVTTLATGMQLQSSAMGLFAPVTTISISVLSRTTQAGDTFEVLAAYFDCALQDVGLANAQVPGLLPPGAYTINGQSVVLSANQTLEQIAALAGTTADQVPLYLPLTQLSTGVVLYALQAGQALSLTTAKVELAQGSDATLTFLVSARSPGASRSLTLDLDYVVNSLEVPTGAPDQKGYQPSQWLSFILPFDETEHTSSQIGQVEIPIPLRAYPDLPVMLQQDAAFTYNPPTTVEQLRRWTYTFAFNFSSSAQDQPTLTIAMNQAPSASMAGAEYSLPEALARFTSVWPQLKPDLALLPQLSPGTANAHASNAIPAFATLVSDVATAWQNWVESANSGSGGGAGYTGMVYTFTAAQFSGNDGTFQDLLLTLSSAPGADHDGTALGWPDIAIMVQGEPVLLDKKPTVGQPPTCTYSYPTGSQPVQTQDVSEWHFAFGPAGEATEGTDAGLDLGTFQNAWAGLSVTRNANLLSNAAIETNPIFVYATPVVGFADKLVPYLATDSIILFNQGTTADLSTALPALLTALAGGAIGQAPAVGVAARYGYQLQPPVTKGLYRTPSGSTADEMIPLLPILISPPTSDIATLGPSMASAIAFWYSKNSLADTQGAGYYFAVNLYSSVDPDNPQPLLKAGRLYYMLTG